MRHLLTTRGIPTDSLSSAVEFLDMASDDFLAEFNAHFGFTPEDGLQCARHIVRAILTGHEMTMGKVGWYVRHVMPETAPEAPRAITMVGVPVLDTDDLTVALVEVSDPESVPTTGTGRRGRRRDGSSAFCKAVRALEEAAVSERADQLKVLASIGIPTNSAMVYLWKYGNGQRQ